MKQYLEMAAIALSGARKVDRTGVGTVGRFGHQIRFDLTEGFPLVTTKKVFTRGIFEELKWFFKGYTDAAWLQERGVNIWNDWALKEPVIVKQNLSSEELYSAIADHRKCTQAEAIDFITQLNGKLDDYMIEHGLALTKDVVKYPVGECGPIYGKQFRRALAVSPDGEVIIVDQLKKIAHDLIKRPFSRRHIVSAWSLGELPDESKTPIDNVKEGRQSLAACHTFFQFYVEQMSEEERYDRVLRKTKYDLTSLGEESLMLASESLKMIDWVLSLKTQIDQGHVMTAEEQIKKENYSERVDKIVERQTRLNEVIAEMDQYVKNLEARDPNTLADLPEKRLSCQLYQR